MANNTAAWSTPFHGVTHLNGKAREWWATVTDRGEFADMSLYYPGCGFNPIKSIHESADEAKTIAEQWLSGQSVHVDTDADGFARYAVPFEL